MGKRFWYSGLCCCLAVSLTLALSGCGGKTEKQPLEQSKEEKSVSVVIPPSMAEEMGVTVKSYEGGKSEAEEGEDGSIILHMTKKEYDSMILKMRSKAKRTLHAFATGPKGDFPAIKKAVMTDDMTSFTFTVEKEAYLEGAERFVPGSCIASARVFQMFNLVKEEDINVKVDVVDEATGEIFETYTYPRQ